MAKYIPADKLKAEIEKRLSIFEHGIAYDCWASCKKIVESLQQEQPEVDLNEEIDRFLKSEESTTYENAGSYKVAVKDLKKIARHFYELGFNEKSDAPKIKGWVARDKSGDLYFFHYDCKPHRTDGVFYSECSEDVFHLDNSMFSEIDWQTEPIEVELTISRVKTE